MTRVLVPVAILEGESVASGLIELLATMDVTVLGYHVLPEQTPPDQARQQYEKRAVSALEDLTGEFRTAGGDAEFRLVFTHDRDQTIARIAEETDSPAYAITGATGDVDNLLVSLSDGVANQRLIEFVTELVGDRDIAVTLLLASDEEAASDRLEAAADRLRGPDHTVRTKLVGGENPFDAIVEAVAGHDAIVVGERAPSLSSLLFGDEAERLASASVGPVVVLRDGDRTEE